MWGHPTYPVTALPRSSSLHTVLQKRPFPSTQQSIVILLTTPTNSANQPMAEQADQREHIITEGLSKLQPAFTTHHHKGVIFRLLLQKDLHRLTAHPCCLASKGVIMRL